MSNYYILKTIIITLLIILSVVMIYLLYKNIDPSSSIFLPKCLSYTIFGIRCPGCGTQRAIYSILNGDILRGVSFNPLIVISIPYLLILFFMDIFKFKYKFTRLYQILYGVKSIWVLLIVLTIYTILRNIFKF